MNKLARLTDDELLTALDDLHFARSNNNADLLLHLAEMRRRRLELARGYDSVHKYCMLKHGCTSQEAYARAMASEAIAVDERIETFVRDGRICMTSLKQAQIVFKSERVRRKKAGEPELTRLEKFEAIKKIAESLSRTAEQVLADAFPNYVKKKKQKRALPGGGSEYSFQLTEEQDVRFVRAKELLSHKKSLEEVLMVLADFYLDRKDPKVQYARAEKRKEAKQQSTQKAKTQPKQKNQTAAQSQPQAQAQAQPQPQPQPEPTAAQPAQPTPTPPTEDQLAFAMPANINAPKSGERTYISVHVNREVHHRAGYRCQWVCRITGRRCDCTGHLQIEHHIPLHLGGTNEISNLRLLCGRHNRFAAEELGIDCRPVKKKNRSNIGKPAH